MNVSGLGNKEIMAANLQYYMDVHGKTRSDLSKDLGFAYSTLSEWLTGIKYPRIDKIEMLANYFGLQKSDLIEERTVLQKEPPLDIDPLEGQLIAAYGEVKEHFDETDIADIKLFMEMVAERKRRKEREGK